MSSVKTLSEDIRRLLCSGNPNKTEMSIQDGLVSEVLADVDVHSVVTFLWTLLI
jgi:hypothetical protein